MNCFDHILSIEYFISKVDVSKVFNQAEIMCVTCDINSELGQLVFVHCRVSRRQLADHVAFPGRECQLHPCPGMCIECSCIVVQNSCQQSNHVIEILRGHRDNFLLVNSNDSGYSFIFVEKGLIYILYRCPQPNMS